MEHTTAYSAVLCARLLEMRCPTAARLCPLAFNHLSGTGNGRRQLFADGAGGGNCSPAGSGRLLLIRGRRRGLIALGRRRDGSAACEGIIGHGGGKVRLRLGSAQKGYRDKRRALGAADGACQDDARQIHALVPAAYSLSNSSRVKRRAGKASFAKLFTTASACAKRARAKATSCRTCVSPW